MNPSGKVGTSDYFSKFRQSFVRDGWEVIDTPPLTNQGKTSADTHIVMDVLIPSRITLKLKNPSSWRPTPDYTL
jgi:hypothetical protein